MMSMIDVGTYGATGQSWNSSNPRPLLEKLMDRYEDPRKKDDKLAIFKAFREEVLSDEKQNALNAIIEYWFTNNFVRLIEEKYSGQKTRKQRAAEARANRAEVETQKSRIKAAAAKLVFLDLMLPNGKSLRDSTGKECASAGGWFAKIAAQIKPNEIVGNALTEKQLRALYIK